MGPSTLLLETPWLERAGLLYSSGYADELDGADGGEGSRNMRDEQRNVILQRQPDRSICEMVYGNVKLDGMCE